MNEFPFPEPDVFFLPLAVRKPDRIRECDPWVLARRIPDFLHQLINQGDAVPTGMLEVQSPPVGDEEASWVKFERAPEADQAFEMLPPGCTARTVVTGRLGMDHEGVSVEIFVHNREDLGSKISATIQVSVPALDPVPALCKLARHLARFLGIEYVDPPTALLTSDGRAFFHFLAGLDGSALLSGDLEIEAVGDALALLKPYQEALALDPKFGLALRTADFTIFSAVEDARIGAGTCCELIDEFLSVLPVDGEGCVQIADHLVGLGEDGRARAWLEHASHLSPPHPKSLENLGILCANNGEIVEARSLWLDGLDLNGHPDFLAHLARLSFTEDHVDDAWDMVLRGLRRIYERCVRYGEWVEDERELGLLLRYLNDHLVDHEPPDDVIEALLDLRGVLVVPEDRIDLGKCFLRLELFDESREEIQQALDQGIDAEYRDEGIRVLLTLEVPDFDRRFTVASDDMAASGDPSVALAEMDHFLAVQPEFWPALFLKAIGLRRVDQEDEALDCLAEVLALCPDQPDALFEMAELFHRRGNPKRALECIEDAIDLRSEDSDLHFAMARYLKDLDRPDAARVAIDYAFDRRPDDPAIRGFRDLLS